jgi:hypothetical protein
MKEDGTLVHGRGMLQQNITLLNVKVKNVYVTVATSLNCAKCSAYKT